MPTGNSQAADLIITQAEVWTGDPNRPAAEAVAVVGDRIAAVGSAAEVGLWRGKHTQELAAQGRLLLPGFNDAHVHFIDGGLQLDSVDLKDSATAEEFVRRVALHVEKVIPGDWILGGGWDEKRWDRPVLPTKEVIDPFTPDLPVLLHRCDLHTALANSVALRLAGVTAATPDPVGGTIVRDSQGEPTGILKDAAIGFIARTIPPLTSGRRLRALNRALEHAASLGVTSVQHMNPTSEDADLYLELAEKGSLTTRVYAAQLETEWAEHGAAGIRLEFGSALYRPGALKGFSDGSLGSATAYFFEPYADAPDTHGLLTDEMQPRSAILDRLLRADKASMQLCLHAIGDQAVCLVLDLCHDIVQVNGARDRRLRIEHAQHVAAPDFKRLAEMGVIASVQPYHTIDDGCWAEHRLGSHRLKTSYPYRSFLDHGVILALGTDWYVAPLNPMLTLYAATTRATLDGKHPDGWIPEQKISMTEAVTAYTRGSAYAEFQDHEKGTITPGKLADMALLSDNIFRIDPAHARNVKVDITIMGGKITYQRSV